LVGLLNKLIILKKIKIKTGILDQQTEAW